MAECMDMTLASQCWGSWFKGLCIGIGDGGQGGPNFADVRIWANFRPKSSKFCQNSEKIWGNLSFFFFFFCSIICGRLTCGISCTPNPILNKEQISGVVKKVHKFPPPPPPPLSDVFSAGGDPGSGFRIWAKRTKNVCAPPPPPKKKNELVPYAYGPPWWQLCPYAAVVTHSCKVIAEEPRTLHSVREKLTYDMYRTTPTCRGSYHTSIPWQLNFCPRTSCSRQICETT